MTVFSTLRRWLAAMTLLLPLASLAAAQDLGSDEILDNLRATAEALTDLRFVLRGELQEGDGSVITLELAVEAIPDARLARAEFIQPDALADNIVVVDGDAVYNYLFLTNQITILNADDPDALGDLIGVSAEGAELDFDVSALFEGWEVSVLGYDDSPAGSVYLLRFDNQEPGADVSYAEAAVVDGEWLPYKVTLYAEDGAVLAALLFEDVVKDPGLEPASLRALPADAEVFDER